VEEHGVNADSLSTQEEPEGAVMLRIEDLYFRLPYSLHLDYNR